MIMVQFAYAAANVLTKIALEKGLDQLVFVVYRHIIALLVLAPFAYILERIEKVTLRSRISQAKVIGTLSSIGGSLIFTLWKGHKCDVLQDLIQQNTQEDGNAEQTVHIDDVNAEEEAVLTRREEEYQNDAEETMDEQHDREPPEETVEEEITGVHEEIHRPTRTRNVPRKLIDYEYTLPPSNLATARKLSPSFNVQMMSDEFDCQLSSHGKENWIKGSCLILVSNIAWSAWLIFQVHVHTVYPATLSLNAWICFFAALQSSLIALFLSNNINGVVISAVVNFLQLWCINKRGPVFAAMFNPLQLIIVGFFSAIAFAERLHLGSLVGAFLIVIGLCSFLWGKNTEAKAQHRKSMAEMCRNPKFENGEEQQTKEKETIETASKDSISRIDAVIES
ncbi:hypothetical protein BVRB_5g103150 [Beta vulgaris subsp. vulgaris]|nr:hypothetical protein BVRB_5g103150 [Beta vulgaris subsp. vulgaris]